MSGTGKPVKFLFAVLVLLGLGCGKASESNSPENAIPKLYVGGRNQMTNQEALTLAKKRWSRAVTQTNRQAVPSAERKLISERWRLLSKDERRAEGKRPNGMLVKLLSKRCTIAEHCGFFLSVKGSGDTWEEAARAAGLCE